MTVTSRKSWLASLVVAGGMLAGCGQGQTGPAELFLDSMLSALTASGTPDLWVASVSGPPSSTSHTGYFVTVTACNQGAGSADAEVNLYLSTDTSITAADTFVGSAPTGMLHPKQCATLHVQTSGSVSLPNGQRYVGAIIDPSNMVGETSETNNTRAGTRIAFGSGPDLQVSQVSAPMGLQPSSPFDAVVTVCNMGTASASGNVDVYFSTDTAITAADTLVGSGPTGPLDEGQCTEVTIPCMASGVSGQRYVGAWVDRNNQVAELVESNNTRVGNRPALGNGPDLLVTAVSGPATLSPSDPLTFEATVCNQGTAPAAAQVEVYLSANSSLTLSDTLVGGAPVDFLDPGQCAPVSITGSASVSSGLWYVGAWVDRSNSVVELVENNNTKIGYRPAVGNGADLIVSEVSGPSHASYSQEVSATATVCNQGTDYSAPTQVSFYLSLDASITTADALLGTAQVPELGAGECAPLEASGSASVHDGTWYVGAFVDSGNNVPELVENNNALAGSLLGVGEGADLVISNITAPASFDGGMPFEASVTVCNQGTQQASSNSRLALYLSQDAAITAADVSFGEMNLPPLSAGQCTVVTIPGMGWVPEGQWTLGAIADLWNTEPELIENNNISSGGTLLVGHGPDFTVAAVQAPGSLMPGQPFEASVTVCNQGTQSGSAGQVTLHLSADADVTPVDMLVGSEPAPWLDMGQCATLQVEGYAGGPEGLGYLGAMADGWDYAPELQEGNNMSTPVRVGVGYKPDLVLTQLSGPASVRPSESFTAAATVCNEGTTPSMSSGSLALHLSRDALISEADWMAAMAPLPHLEPGDCTVVGLEAWAGVPDGVWTLGVRLDPSQSIDELREDNNAVAGERFAVGFGPDLIVSGISGPNSARRHDSFQVTATVCNQGTEPASGTHLDFFFSGDATFSEEQDEFAGGAPVPPLEPGQCRAVQVDAYAHGEEGLWYFGARVNGFGGMPELRKDNNTHLVADFAIGDGPDLALTQVAGPPNARSSDPFTVTATVCNHGTQYASNGHYEFYLSSDATLDQGDMPLDGGPVEPLEPGQCRIVSREVYGGMPDGEWTLVARVETGGYPSGGDLRASNDTLAGGTIVFGYGADFVVTAITAPPSIQMGEDFEATVTVCNQGTEPGWGGHVALLYSADAFITLNDDYAGGRPLDTLEPGQCRALKVPVHYTPWEGLWTLGALIESNPQELRKDNNTFVGGSIAVGHGPDLAITELSAPETASSYGTFPVDITVCNHGTEPSYMTSMDLLFSTDAAFGGDDDFAGYSHVPPLPVGECATLRARADVSGGFDGPAYFAARINGGGPELRTDNDARFQPVVIGEGRDLAVTHVSGPYAVAPGQISSAAVTVCNQGSQPSGGEGVELFLSDPTLIPSAEPMGGGYVPPLEPGACATVNVEGSAYAPGQGSEWLLGARIDSGCCGNEDLRPENDSLAEARLIIGYGTDLAVTQIQAPASVQGSDYLSAQVTVCNQGTDPAGPRMVELFLSEDQVLDMYADNPVGGAMVDPLDPGACQAVSVEGPVGVPDGAWTLVAQVDSSGPGSELSEDNNVLAQGILAVGEEADLVVTQVSGPLMVEPYTSFTAEATVCNQGTQPSMPLEVGFFISYDTQVTANDLLAGSVQVPGLAPGECIPVSGSASVEVWVGPVRLGARVDPWEWVPELREDNNGAVGAWMGVGIGPELYISSVTGPASVTPGQSFQVTVTACNASTQPLSGVELAVVLSADGTITETDARVGMDWVSLAPEECQPVDVYVSYPTYEGTWTLGAYIDPNDMHPELIEQNNGKAGGTLGVGYKAELVVTSVWGPSSVMSGGGFMTDVEVCNQGTEPSMGTDVVVVFSTDGSFSLDDVVAGGEYTGSLPPGQCAYLSVPGTAYPGPGTYYLGVIVDPNAMVEEFNETNNTASGGSVDVL